MHDQPAPRTRTTRLDQVFLIELNGETDFDDTAELDAAWAAADEAALPTTAIDLSGVAFADSMLLNSLLGALARHQATGRELILLGPLPDGVRRLLSLSGTLEHFTVADTGPSQDS
ncbi:STAS domain-containing protein [Streptomyces sp. NPDC001941]|uniref:STAS domain-containing protein n=1 Tax=Streptomyces sp. NPDC001941 TaxID=3154659 RepID=UPI003323FFB8